MKPILEVQDISKKFKIVGEQLPYLNIRERLTGILKAKNRSEDFWALKDVSFNVMPGDTIGIIGKNGAGKSTLLKILSKITPPTSGKIIGRGRIASLLEVGTGFHSELSGRENIFMNGSILGMRKSEIIKNFDAIVDFSGVEKFIDTPLKHYSSGMQLRLAFAVSAFLENEILIIDEVLAVGDADFQKKCMKKMHDVSESGRTILFVSHQMGAVKNLCKKSFMLRQGRLVDFGESDQIIKKYFSENSDSVATFEKVIDKIEVKQNTRNIEIYVSYSLEKEIDYPNFGFVVYNVEQIPVFGSNPMVENISLSDKKYRKGEMRIVIESPVLNDGTYSMSIWFGDKTSNFFEALHCLSFDIAGSTLNRQLSYNIVGSIAPKCNWEIY